MKTLNLKEAAAFLHINAEELRARAKRGAIPGAKIGRRWVFLESDLAEFIRSNYPAKQPSFSWKSQPHTMSTSDGLDLMEGRAPSRRVSKEYEALLWPASNSSRRDRNADPGQNRTTSSAKAKRQRKKVPK